MVNGRWLMADESSVPINHQPSTMRFDPDEEVTPMPGPFPGMDPYLEAPILWPGAHDALIFGVRRALNAVLPPQGNWD
jgi:hypothetical protein